MKHRVNARRLANAITGMQVGDFVPAGCECPYCGERHMDRLSLDENDVVLCGNCGRTYHL